MIKIDRSFTADLTRTPRGPALVTAVADLAHASGHDVIAEGVETARQHDLVRAAGCEAAQGFHYAHPMSAADPQAHLSSLSAAAPDAELATNLEVPRKQGQSLR